MARAEAGEHGCIPAGQQVRRDAARGAGAHGTQPVRFDDRFEAARFEVHHRHQEGPCGRPRIVGLEANDVQLRGRGLKDVKMAAGLARALAGNIDRLPVRAIAKGVADQLDRFRHGQNLPDLVFRDVPRHGPSRADQG
jgi:hypothetical protein